MSTLQVSPRGPGLEDEEDEEIQPEEVTRCICGNIDLVTEEDHEDNGLFVQCDDCLVWQHGYCVGLLMDSQMPDTYHCEICRPDLHQIMHRPRKSKVSKYLGVDNASSPSGAHDDADEPELAGPRKRRSTMNSRDAAYDRQLEAALLLSAQHDNGPTHNPSPSISGRSGRSTKKSSPPLASKRGRNTSPSPIPEEQNKKRRKKGAASVKVEDSIPEIDTSSRRKRGGKKRSNASHHQAQDSEGPEEKGASGSGSESSRLLSSRTSHKNAPQTATTTHHYTTSSIPPSDSLPPSRAPSRESTPQPSSNTTTQALPPYAASRKRGGGGGGGGGGGAVAATAGERAGGNNGSRGSSHKKAIPSITRSTTTLSSATTTTTTAPFTMPSTPSGKLYAWNEMRRRVSAILEFVGRAQLEMAAEREEWASFTGPGAAPSLPPTLSSSLDQQQQQILGDRASRVEGLVSSSTRDGASSSTSGGIGAGAGAGPRVDTVWQYGESPGGSVESMEKLTGALLRWESQYG